MNRNTEPGGQMTDPVIVDWPETHFAAISAEVRMPFGDMIGPAMGEVAGYLEASGSEIGLAIFRYEIIDMPRLEIQLGFTTRGPVAGTDRVRPHTLPAGRYATVTYTGPYDDLQAITGRLIGWAQQNGVEWDSEMTAQGERFAGRAELYFNGPMDEPDPMKWQTQILIKTRAGR